MVETADVLQSWGDFDLAEELLRYNILVAKTMLRFKKKEWTEYLDTYLGLLRKLGRHADAALIEATPAEQWKELEIFKDSDHGWW